MAVRKSINLLPGVFQTATNEKFLSATVDQLISEPNLKNLYGYIGRQFAPTYKSTDSYLLEGTDDRQNYQLEPSTIVKTESGDTTFFCSYVDFLNQVRYHGGNTTDHSRLFTSEYYSFDPQISFDKFVNFGQYYWLPNGPSTVQVNTSGVELIQTYQVSRDETSNSYKYTAGGQVNNTLILARGGSYTFEVDQSAEFWIQSELGLDGRVNATPTVSTRAVLGVDNNGSSSGVVTFNVPQRDAQARFTAMNTAYNVDYAAPLPFTDLHNHFVSDFLANYPQYAGITGSLDGKTLVFVDQQEFVNRGEEVWTVSGEQDSIGITYDYGTVIPEDKRFGVWQIQLIPVGNEFLINAFPILDIAQDEKVYVKYGIGNANREFYKEYTGLWERVPPLTAQLDTLYIQDGSRADIYTKIKIVEFDNFVIDVENDIIGQQNYTSPNGIEFTSGLKIQFDTDVTPTTYQGKTYYVENVGDAIRLVDVNLLVTPEGYNTELDINYPMQRITLDTAIVSTIPAATTLTIGSNTITTVSETLAGSSYITTLDSIAGINKGDAVTGVYFASGTTVYDAFRDNIFPEYITIKRDAIDMNAWSRNNRWFHIDIIKQSAEYNNEKLIFDQRLRAQRPIVQFEGDLQLFNNGRIGKPAVDILDTDITDAFTALEGQVLTTAFGVTLVDGMRVIFGADTDPLVKNKIYVLNLVQYQIDPATNLPTGDFHIKLVKADDGDVEEWDTVVVKQGKYKGSGWWFDGVNWQSGQEKTHLQQNPLFEVYDYDSVSGRTSLSFSDTTRYPRTTFAGCALFGYQVGTGTNDTVLGFPLSYRSFNSQGDILFTNFFNTDTFTYVQGQETITESVNKGFLVNIIDRNTVKQRNTWKTVVEPSKQYQLITYIYGPGFNPYVLDIAPISLTEWEGNVPRLKVYKNGVFLTADQYSFNDTTNELTLVTEPANGDVIDVQVFSKQVSEVGYYQIPLNLDLNAQNVDINNLTLGQLRNHLVALSRNSVDLVGDVLGPNNLRDIEIKAQGGTILQHSAPVPFAELFLLDQQANFVEAVKLASREYSKFKNKFLELSVSLQGIDPLDPISSVDLILTRINLNKNSTFPWYFSDMVPYGTLKNTITYTVFDPLIGSYEITNVFSTVTLGNQAILVYVNDQQLVLGKDYTFDTDRPAVTFNVDQITLEIDDVITIVEYQNTDGCYVPETPSKVGSYPKFIPALLQDDTYRAPINVIRGHDGSITPAFGDYRDDFLLELERRIYNNIKLPETNRWRDVTNMFPGKFRSTDYNYEELSTVLSKTFLTWVGNNKVDFSTNTTFKENDSFTWNYNRFVDRLDGEYLQGSWRAVFQYFYDTTAPHQRPWEMLGFYSEPTWWQDYYGPAPYSGSNKLLWDDLEAGIIRGGDRAGIDEFYARPGLASVIPVNENGFLKSPAQAIARATNPLSAADSWAVGQYGPTENAWRNSSDYAYAVQIAAALMKPAVYFSQFIDTYGVYYNTDLNQYLTLSNHHIRQTDVVFNGDTTSGTVTRSAGYLNWISDYLRNIGIDPASKISTMLKNYEVKLAYKMAGFSDKKYLQILAEQSSPTSTNDSVLIPNENYEVLLNKSTPTDKIVYSAVIVEKTTNGYSVRGYDLTNPFFTVIPSRPNNNSYKIQVLNATGIIYKNYLEQVLTVPYGYEFKSYQQVVDFLVSYERYLTAQGCVFETVDPDLKETRNWRLSVKELLLWVQQGWKAGSLLVLSPITNQLDLVTEGSIVDGITDSQTGSKVVDQNFNLIKNTDYIVNRSPTSFSVRLSNEESVIALVELSLVQYEHALIFDNTTVFDDVIYKPELGNRQYRLKLIGQKTADWDGSLYAPGFIYNSETVAQWQAGKDYLKGDLVEYKNRFYTALQNVVAATDFEFAFWKQLANNEIKTGLLNNFSTINVGGQSFYDSYGDIKDNNQLSYSHGLIGFKPRQYLTDLGLSETTQIELYKGYIKQKGSTSAVKALNNATFNNLSSAISFYEEWAVRTGEYGALDSNPFVEIPLDEKAYSVNPALAEFVGVADNNRGDGIVTFNESQLYRSAGAYTGNIALLRNEFSDYDKDILTAGYVNIDDVDATVFDLNDYIELNDDLTNVGAGYRIWVAKDFTGNWNVYRITETNNKAVGLEYIVDDKINWTFATPHGLSAGEVFVVRNFDDNTFDGYYQVYAVVDLKTVQVAYQGDVLALEALAEAALTGDALFYVLNSMRFQFMEDARVYGYNGNPKNGWKEGDKIWIDVDAATSLVQGQRYEVPSGGWKVYEKTKPWNYGQTLQKSSAEYKAGTEYGKAVKLSYDGLLAITGAPYANTTPWYGALELSIDTITTGKVYTFDKNTSGEFVEGLWLEPNAGNAQVQTKEYGYSVDQAIGKVAVGAPGSYGNLGFVYVYNREAGITTYDTPQVVWSGNVNATNDKFGSSISLDQTGSWLYVGAPNNDRVYVYGLNTRVTPQRQLVSVNDEAILQVSAVINANIGDLITQPTTGASAFVVNVFVGTSNVELRNVSGFITGNTAGNIYINNIDSLLYANLTYTRSVTTKLTTAFTPNVTNSAPSLTISNSVRTFIPDIDYTVSGTNIIFNTNTANASGNLVQDTYLIEQRPYYTLHATLQGNPGERFGYAMDSSLDGAQLGVGAPDANVWVDGEWIQGAGAVYVYDRVIEAFKSTGAADYTTRGNIDLVHKVTVDELNVDDFTIPGGIGSNVIRFNNPPVAGKVVFIETNQFNLLEKLIGIDSLEGGLSAIQANTAFGTSLTICSNNCAIYVGAPYYNNLPEYNTGAVWKFHNRGRLYGTNTGQEIDPVFTPGDTLRLDNFEVVVEGRMMPGEEDTTAAVSITGIPELYIMANVLTLNTSVVAVAGQTISQDQGGGNYANVIVVANTAVSGSKHIAVAGNITLAGYTTTTQFKYGPGNVVSIGGTISSAYPMASLDSLVQDVNDANILGVSAINENNLLRLDSDRTVAKNLLRILSGSNTTSSEGVFADAGMAVFAFMQIIVNPFNTPGEYFGNKVVLAQNAYMLVISSERGTTRAFTTFDSATTYFDDTSTNIFDSAIGSGSVYIYELYDDPRDAVEDPGRYAYAQQLNTGDLNIGDRFGADIDIIGTDIIVSAPADDSTVLDAGSVYIFKNPAMTRGWNLIRYQQDKVDIESVNRIFLYSSLTNTILTNLEYIDPAKGKILGQADQEITYKTEYDPAVYNRGTGANGQINTQIYWGASQVGQVWWNLDKIRYIDYEQDTLTYRSINWGRLFPGSVVEVAEWVESTVVPSQYVAAGNDGVPKFADNSAYVEITYVDPNTNIIDSKFYFWVVGKTSVDPNNPRRSLPISTVADYILNPKAQGIAYAAIIQSNSLIVYNVGGYLSAQNTILHLDYEIVKNTSVIHSEYELLQKGNPYSMIPEKISNKLIDSLSGEDVFGKVVPDPQLSLADRYGINIRPRQSMFVDRLQAMTNLIDYVNDVLITRPIAREFDLATLMSQDPKPTGKLNEFDQEVETDQILQYIDTGSLPTGYKVLVAEDTTQDNLWVIYQLSADKTWDILQVQSYKTSLYWEYVDWYAEGYGPTNKLDYVVNTLVDAKKLPVASGQEVLVRVNNSSTYTGWVLYTVNEALELIVVGIQNGTIQLKTSLADFAANNIGMGNQGFDAARFDENPSVETRYVLQALKDDIFINQLQGEYNKLFFVMVNYLFNEQKYVDWIFKTSFVSVTHYLRSLLQPANYIKDNVTYYEDYINEVKPYVTKVREYLLSYTGDDTFGGDITDFDLAPYYDTKMKIFRSPSGEEGEKDTQLWATGYNIDTNQLVNIDYPNWYGHRSSRISSIVITDPGVAYTSTPIITVSGGNADKDATAIAEIDGDTGQVINIEVTDFGNGYISSPTVSIVGTVASNVDVIGGNVTAGNVFYVSAVDGLYVGMTANLAFYKNASITAIDSGNSTVTMSSPNISTFTGQTISFGGRPARAYAILENNQVRSFDTTIKFDRVSYGTSVQQWGANTYFYANTIVSYQGVGYRVLANGTTGSTFISNEYAVYSANLFNNANDRVMAYYAPTSDMPSKDLNQLIPGIEYPGVQVQGLNFNQQPGLSGDIVANITFSGPITVSSGNVIVQPEADVLLNFDYPITANIGQIITQASSGANVTVYGNINVNGTLGNVVAGTSVYVLKNNEFEFDLTGNVLLDGTVLSTPIFVANTSIPALSYWANVEIKPQETTVAGVVQVEVALADASVEVTKVWSPTKIEGIIRTSADFVTSNSSVRLGNVKVNNAWVSVYPTTIDYLTSTAGQSFDSETFDNVEYNSDGIAELGSGAYDTLISSTFTDTLLGTRPEDINIDGGKFVDAYASHAPEELVPGRVFDTLDMRVYTAISGNTVTLGYRVFHDLTGNVSYTRISDQHSTSLASELTLSDTEIVVDDATKLSLPNIEYNIPGVIFVNGERITYWRNYAREVTPWTANTNFAVDSIVSYSGNNYITTGNVYAADFVTANVTQLDNINVLAQIRRGTAGTAINELHTVGKIVTDAGRSEIIPGTSKGNLTLGATATYGNAYVRTITAGTVLETETMANVWVNWIANVRADGTGMEGAITDSILFLKAAPAGNVLVASIPDNLTTEDAINTITTESGAIIIEED